ncbi:MAG TPA: hypothetical protein VG323_03750 [Thermoanaerobaculia bacterium]|nr:hypothetical protein [Thermoanaerobaculia bacterium]
MQLSVGARVVIAVALAIAAGIASRWIKQVYPQPVFGLETTFSQDNANAIIKASPDVVALRKSIYIDFLFIPCYTALLWFLCMCAGNRLFAAGALVAGALDAFVENPIMLLEIDGRSNKVLTFLKALGSWTKWLLLGVVIVYLVFAGFVALKQSLALKLRR